MSPFRRNGIKGNEQEKFLAKEWATGNNKFTQNPFGANIYYFRWWALKRTNRSLKNWMRKVVMQTMKIDEIFFSRTLFASFNSRFLSNVQTSDVEVKIITFHNSIKVEYTFVFGSNWMNDLMPDKETNWSKKEKNKRFEVSYRRSLCDILHYQYRHMSVFFADIIIFYIQDESLWIELNVKCLLWIIWIDHVTTVQCFV